MKWNTYVFNVSLYFIYIDYIILIDYLKYLWEKYALLIYKIN